MLRILTGEDVNHLTIGILGTVVEAIRRGLKHVEVAPQEWRRRAIVSLEEARAGVLWNGR